MVADAKETTTFSREMEPDAQDVQSAVYWLRTRPLRVGEHDSVPIVAGKRQWTMEAEVIDQAPLETPAGRFDAVRVQISTAFAGKLPEPEGHPRPTSARMPGICRCASTPICCLVK